MAHKASKLSQKYLEKYLRERGVPLHNERVAELSHVVEREAARTANSQLRAPLQGPSGRMFATQTSDGSLPVNGL